MVKPHVTSDRTVASLLDLRGKVALVTGGASGGFATAAAAALLEAGAAVVITSRDTEKASRCTATLGSGERVRATTLELTDPASIDAAVAYTVAQFGRLDILVNGAAALCMDPVETVSPDDFNLTLTANVTGTLLASRAAAARMQQGGVILNMASIYGVVSPDPRLYGESGLNSPLVYGASKAAIIQMTRYLSVHWAPTIRVNCVTPGGLHNRQPDDFVERYCARTPLGRMGAADDLKGAVLFLVSDASSWVTGQNIVVDGGWTVW